MRVLVTGATDFVGGHAARSLHALGRCVLASGRDRVRGERLADSGLAFRPADLTCPEEADALCRGVDAIVHCAALSAPWGARRAFWRANVDATEHLLRAADRHDVQRFVHLSSSSVYARPFDQFALREDAPLPRRGPGAYAESKREAEARVRRSSVPHVILRPRGIFGPGDTSLLPRLVDALARQRLPQIGTDDTLTDLTEVRDVVRAMEAALGADGPALNRTYNISGGEPIRLWPTIRRIAAALDLPPPRRALSFGVAYALAAGLEAGAALTGREPQLTRYTVGLLGKTTTLDIGEAMTRLGYRPAVSMEDGIDRFLSWRKASSEASGNAPAPMPRREGLVG